MNYNLRERMMATSPDLCERERELEQKMRDLPVARRRVFIVLVMATAIPWVFFGTLAEGFWFSLRLAMVLVKGEIACARRVWRR